MTVSAQTCTVPEAAAVLGISKTTAYELIRTNSFPVPVLKVGRSRKVSVRQLEVFIHGDQAAPAAPDGGGLSLVPEAGAS